MHAMAFFHTEGSPPCKRCGKLISKHGATFWHGSIPPGGGDDDWLYYHAGCISRRKVLTLILAGAEWHFLYEPTEGSECLTIWKKWQEGFYHGGKRARANL